LKHSAHSAFHYLPSFTQAISEAMLILIEMKPGLLPLHQLASVSGSASLFCHLLLIAVFRLASRGSSSRPTSFGRHQHLLLKYVLLQL
jgi:hypothetical protein